MKENPDTPTGHPTIRESNLANLCDKFGTPLFVFDENLLRENYRRIHHTFKTRYPNVAIAYSIKTNYNLAICGILREEGSYAAVASGLDLYVAKEAGFPSERIVFDGLYKSQRDLYDALKSELLIINAESFSELERLNRLAGKMGVKQDVGIRINFAKRRWFLREVFDNEAIHCYPSSRFGFPMQDAYMAFKQASKLENLNVAGIMTHPYHVAIKTILSFINRIHKELGVEIRFLNLGGGFSKTRRIIGTSDLVKDFIRQRLGFSSKLDKRKKNIDLETIAKSITNETKRALKDMPLIVLEPGSYIVGDAGCLLLRVECVKEASGHKWVIVDGGTNLVPDYWERREIHIVNRDNTSPTEMVNVVGPLLYPNDFVAIKQSLPKVREGDVLAVSSVGAYTLSQSNQFLYPRSGAVLLGSDGRIRQIREKETYRDVLQKDRKA